MLNPDDKQRTIGGKAYPQMNAEQRASYQQAVAEELAGREENVRATRQVAERLLKERERVADLVAELKAAREAAGVSLSEMEERTGILKSALSRLENAKSPNPTLATLHRYAAAIGRQLEWSVELHTP
ncbi:MAG: helix-turn-helix transcriptional regulator [Planctomycetales bacterium]|nr:helix-turn-helix transcriptional regulator [Planctomycetales bacterium]